MSTQPWLRRKKEKEPALLQANTVTGSPLPPPPSHFPSRKCKMEEAEEEEEEEEEGRDAEALGFLKYYSRFKKVLFHPGLAGRRKKETVQTA